MRFPAVAASGLIATVLLTVAFDAPLPVVEANDNRSPAGRLVGDSLFIVLDVEYARWFPEADDGPSLAVAAFRERGKPPRIPGPLIRVPTGTMIVATIRNALPDSTLTIRGFVTRPASAGSGFQLRPGESRTLRFSAGEPGTYFYSAEQGKVHSARPGVDPVTGRRLEAEREQLAGAFIIDAVGGSLPDRVFMLNIWGELVDTVYRSALAINGKSWPHSETLHATAGDSLRWRVINPTTRDHPMHLHGVYYRVDSKGDGLADTSYAPASRRLVVTEVLERGQTMTLGWRPDRPGNWLFHCHLMFHASHLSRLSVTPHDAHSADVTKHMAGLVLGIVAQPRPDETAEPRPEPRRLILHALQGPPRGRAKHAMSFVLQRDDLPPASDSVENPGSLLVLTRNQPTDITVINRMAEATSIHWHGIELESWSDGVPGWSGAGNRLAPAVAPGDSFTARLTLPRAGTFIYHTHLNDVEQVSSGLYGAIVVLEPGQRYDPETDHVFLNSWSGPRPPPRFLMNGDSVTRVMRFKGGVTHRLRFINIGAAARPIFWLVRDSTLQTWRPVAKDGADLPAAQSQDRPAVLKIDVGETYDMMWKPPAPGEYSLRAGPARQFLIYRIVVE